MNINVTNQTWSGQRKRCTVCQTVRAHTTFIIHSAVHVYTVHTPVRRTTMLHSVYFFSRLSSNNMIYILVYSCAKKDDGCFNPVDRPKNPNTSLCLRGALFVFLCWLVAAILLPSLVRILWQWSLFPLSCHCCLRQVPQ